MLRQLSHLTRSVGGTRRSLALAVYADEQGKLLPATDRGYEGVACVDDAARALSVLADLWSATRLPVIRTWADGLLDFVLSMQDANGRFVNFVHDWAGARNDQGPTSVPGGSFWQARGLRGLASAWIFFGDDRARAGVLRAMALVRDDPVPATVRAIHIQTAVELLRAGRMPELAVDLGPWCAELVANRRHGILLDDPDQTEPHLWGHVQEAALADAGALLGRADLVGVARESALRYLAPLIESGFDLPTVQPDGVASALLGVERLAAVTAEPRFAALTVRARAWFDGVDLSGRPVYDRATGRVADGVDSGSRNSHSGAESNVAGAQALRPELGAIARAHRVAIERVLSPLLA